MILKKRKVALGLQMLEINGINPALCMQKIYMYEGYKESAKHIERLNPLMKDLVTQEAIKLLDEGIVYHIYDSKWVSVVQCVPK